MNIVQEHRAYEVVPAPLCIIRESVLIYANPAFGAFLGLDRTKLVGRSVFDLTQELVAPEDREWVAAMSKRLEQGARNQPPALWVRLSLDDKHPRMIHCLQHEGPRDGEYVMVLQPAESERKVHAFTAALAGGAASLMRCHDENAVLDLAAQILFDNGLWANVMLIKGDRLHHGPMRHDPGPLKQAEALMGKPMAEHSFPLSSMPHVAETLRTRRATFHHDFNAFSRAHHEPDVAAIIDTLPAVQAVDAPLIVGNEGIGLLNAIGKDLTPAMAASVELFAQHVSAAIENARGHKLLEQRLDQLQKLQSDLVEQERLAALAEAAAVMAHEVRNPLGAILNGFALIKKQAPALTAEARGVLAMAEEEAQRLESIVRDMLDLTRPIFPKPMSFDMTALVHRAVQVIRDRQQDDGVRIEVKTTAPNPITADPQLLQLAVQNLVRNAVQASPKNGTVTVSVEPAPDGVRICVEDQGRGVAEEDAERIFDPFFTTRATGTGLGLPLVRRVAEAHQGTIELKTGTKTGARFELTVPNRT